MLLLLPRTWRNRAHGRCFYCRELRVFVYFLLSCAVFLGFGFGGGVRGVLGGGSGGGA